MSVAAGLGAFISAAIIMPSWRKFTEWRHFRNNLDDDVRAEIYWNDERYERLMWWVNRSPLIAIGLLIVWGVIYGMFIGP